MKALVYGAGVLGVAAVLTFLPRGSVEPTVGLAPALAAQARPGAPPAAADEVDGALSAMIRRNCVTWHNDPLLTGQLSLQSFNVASAAEQAQTSERMIRKLRANMMPPPGMPRPGGDTLTLLVQRLEE